MTDPTESQALVRRQPVPRELASLGVTVAEDEASGMQMVIIPDAVKARANVLMPVQAFQQADPHWTPSMRMVQLNPSKDGPHFYKQAGNKLAPLKQALELLADAAGVVSTRVTLVPGSREARQVGGVRAEAFEHHAVLHIRKSDGTLRLIEGGKNYEPDAEYEEIRDSVTNATGWENGQRTNKPKYATEEEREAEIRKRWLAEIKNAKAKNESKAVLRAIRSALQIPHTFTAADAQKPFLVVGWNFTPPNDPETRTAIATAIATMYGTGPAPVQETHMLERPAEASLPAFSGPETPQEPEDDAETAKEPGAAENGAQPVREHLAGCALDPGHEGGCKDAEGRFLDPDGPSAPTPSSEPEPEPDPGPIEEEPEHVVGEVVEEDPFEPPGGVAPEVELANEAGKLIPPVGMFSTSGSAGGGTGLTLAEIVDYADAKDPERGKNWIGWALRNWEAKGYDPVFLEALRAFAAVYTPDLIP